jgi:hypothetical protein
VAAKNHVVIGPDCAVHLFTPLLMHFRTVPRDVIGAMAGLEERFTMIR